MSSYVQVIIGGILLVTAFLFGRHINNKPILPTTQKVDFKDAETDSQSLVRQKPQTVVAQNEEANRNTLQKNLRERILGDREKNRQEQNENVAKNDSPDSPFLLPDQEIVVPDFSNLSFTAASDSLQTTKESNPTDISPDVLPPKKDLGSRHKYDDVVVGPLPQKLPSKVQKKIQQNTGKISVLSKPKPITKRGKFQVGNRSDYLIPIRRESNADTEVDQFVTYKTVFGDTLHGLSNHFFGKPDYYLDIYLANRDRMKNPSTVPINTTLKIPLVAELINQPSNN